MDYPITRSWWETLPREALEQAAIERGQAWKAKRGHVSFAPGLEAMRDAWDLKGTRAPKLFTPEPSTDE